jgi:hypothetical protein
MKKSLLLLSGALVIGSLTNAQTTLTFAGEPAIGSSSVRFVVDSNAANLATATGTAQTWDYSNIFGYSANTKIDSVVDATTAPNTSDFPASSNTLRIPGYMDSYYQYVGTTEKSIDGFVMDFGGVNAIVKYDVDAAKSLTFPFAYGDNFTDAVSGNLGGAVTGTITGTTKVTADGTGTLKLFGKDFTGALRIHTRDSIVADLGMLGTATIIRNQYDYMVSDSAYPVFTHTSTAIASLAINQTLSVVLSAVNPPADAGIDEATAVTFNMYPNTTNGNVIISMDKIQNASIEVVNAVGQTVKTIIPTTNQTTFSLTDQVGGMYFVKVVSGNSQKTMKLIVR